MAFPDKISLILNYPDPHDSTKQQLEEGIATANTVAFIPRIVGEAISDWGHNFCKHSWKIKKICNGVEWTAKKAVEYIPDSIKTELHDFHHHIFVIIPQIWEKEYGIPAEESAYGLESLGITTITVATAPLFMGGEWKTVLQLPLKAPALSSKSAHSIPKKPIDTLGTHPSHDLKTWKHSEAWKHFEEEFKSQLPVVSSGWETWVQESLKKPGVSISEIKVYKANERSSVRALKIENKSYVLKQNFGRFKEFFSEIVGLQRLHSLNLRHSQVPRPLAICELEGDSYAMLMPQVPSEAGRTILSLIDHIGSFKMGSPLRTEHLKECMAAVSKAGEAIGEIHFKSRRSFKNLDRDYFKQDIERYIDRTIDRVRYASSSMKFPQINYQQVVDSILQNPGPATVLHSDFHIENVLWCAKTKKLGLIDPEFFTDYLHPSERPLGLPAEDCYRFRSDLERYAINRGLSFEEIALLKRQFAAGYSSEFKGPISRHTEALFRVTEALDSLFDIQQKSNMKELFRKQLIKQSKKELDALANIRPHISQSSQRSMTTSHFFPNNPFSLSPYAAAIMNNQHSPYMLDQEKISQIVSDHLDPENLSEVVNRHLWQRCENSAEETKGIFSKASDSASIELDTDSSNPNLLKLEDSEDEADISPSIALAVKPSLTHPKKSGIEFMTDVADETIVGISTQPLEKNGEVALSLMTTEENTTAGVVVKPSDIRKTQIVVSANLGNYGKWDVRVVPAKPLHSTIAAEVPVSVYGVPLLIGAQTTLKRPECTQLNVSLPIQPLALIGKALGVSLPHKIPLLSANVKTTVQKIGRMCGFRKKKRRYKEPAYTYSEPENLLVSKQTLKNFDAAAAELMQSKKAKENALHKRPSLQEDAQLETKAIAKLVESTSQLEKNVRLVQLDVPTQELRETVQALNEETQRMIHLSSELQTKTKNIAQRLKGKMSLERINQIKEQLKNI